MWARDALVLTHSKTDKMAGKSMYMYDHQISYAHIFVSCRPSVQSSWSLNQWVSAWRESGILPLFFVFEPTTHTRCCCHVIVSLFHAQWIELYSIFRNVNCQIPMILADCFCLLKLSDNVINLFSTNKVINTKNIKLMFVVILFHLMSLFIITFTNVVTKI